MEELKKDLWTVDDIPMEELQEDCQLQQEIMLDCSIELEKGVSGR